MQEEHPLSEPPQRRGAELARTGLALADAVGQPDAHVVHQQVGEQVRPAGCASAAIAALPVVNDGVWQSAQPTLLKSVRPAAIEGAPPGVVGDGVGGASKPHEDARSVSIELIAVDRRRRRPRR